MECVPSFSFAFSWYNHNSSVDRDNKCYQATASSLVKLQLGLVGIASFG